MDDENLLIKRSSIYCNLLQQNKILEKEINRLKKKNEGVTKKRKNYFDTKKNQKLNFRREFLSSLQISDKLADAVGLKIRKIVLTAKNNITEDATDLSIEDSNSDKDSQLIKSIFIKDKSNISNRCYQSLITELKCDLPSLRKIQCKKKELNELLPTFENTMGCYCNIKLKLTKIVDHLIEKNMIHISNNKILIKLAGDSTNLFHGNKTLVVSFSIINEYKATSASGTYVIGIFNILKEDYFEINKSVAEIKEDYKNLETITIKDQVYKIQKFLGGDWKFLAICAGIKSANSNYPCIWCKTKKHSSNRNNYKSENWSIKPINNNNRSLQEANEIISNGKEAFCHQYSPIFNFLPFTSIIPDLLHLFLRITGKLSKIFFKKLQQEDGYNTKFFQTAYEEFLCINCQINSPIVIDEQTNRKILRDLKGDEFLRISKNINELTNIFENFNRISDYMNVWNGFFSIYFKIKKNEFDHKNLKEETLKWFGDFLSIYSHEEVTPYMHVFVFHLHEFIELYGDLDSFNLQGLEKKNDIITCQYYRATNRKQTKRANKKEGIDYIKQLFLKNNRIDILSSTNE